MKYKPTEFDFAYAVKNTDILFVPTRPLDPFQPTAVDYTLLTQPMDNPHQTCIRVGKLQTFTPEVVDPTKDIRPPELEGFGKESERYINFLAQHASRVRILRYAYRLKREGYSEKIVNQSIDQVRETMLEQYKRSTNPYIALVQGVEEPWDVCLLHLFTRLVQNSVKQTLEAIEKHEEDAFKAKLRTDDLFAIEQAFALAQKDPTQRNALGNLLKEKGLFDNYQDRFFDLFK